jgi:hypothetical protein
MTDRRIKGTSFCQEKNKNLTKAVLSQPFPSQLITQRYTTYSVDAVSLNMLKKDQKKMYVNLKAKIS